MSFEIRALDKDDEAQALGVWWRSGSVEYTYLRTWQAMSFEQASAYFQDTILKENQVWVGVLKGHVVALLAMQGSYLDRLYVCPNHQKAGYGTKLLEFAKSLSKTGIVLHTHQKNYSARRFYEKHGFTATQFGVSPAPESEPDVQYQWKPA